MNHAKIKSKAMCLRYLAVPLVYLILAFVPFCVSTYYVSLIMSILYWTTLAFSWFFFSGQTNYASLGSAAFLGMGAYIMAILSNVTSIPIILGVVCLMSFLTAFIIGLVTLRLRGIYFAMFTLGLCELLKNSILWWEVNVSGTVGRWTISFNLETVYYFILGFNLIFLLLFGFLLNSKLGLGLKAIGENEEAAEHLGVNTSLYKTLGFAISTIPFGLIGACLSTRWIYIDPRGSFDTTYSFMPAIMVLLGGTESAYAPLISAMILSVLAEFLLVSFRDLYMLILGSVLLVLLTIFPGGLSGVILKIKKARTR